MTHEEHRERHKILHAHLDELFADYIENHPSQTAFTDRPIMELLEWSYQQTLNPDDLTHCYEERPLVQRATDASTSTPDTPQDL